VARGPLGPSPSPHPPRPRRCPERPFPNPQLPAFLLTSPCLLLLSGPTRGTGLRSRRAAPWGDHPPRALPLRDTTFHKLTRDRIPSWPPPRHRMIGQHRMLGRCGAPSPPTFPVPGLSRPSLHGSVGLHETQGRPGLKTSRTPSRPRHGPPPHFVLRFDTTYRTATHHAATDCTATRRNRSVLDCRSTLEPVAGLPGQGFTGLVPSLPPSRRFRRPRFGLCSYLGSSRSPQPHNISTREAYVTTRYGWVKPLVRFFWRPLTIQELRAPKRCGASDRAPRERGMQRRSQGVDAPLH
jgi:hypothetical protein